MLLKSLEIYGFKSFADRTKIQFDKGITGIVGPNGSGKSNILDAIKWVLGEQSAKSLRGDKMEDIIFAGTQDRNSLGFAEVSLTLDNSNAKLPLEFTEVTVTRRLYRSGESEYYINRNQCRLKDISELFMDTGVGKEGYSIIGQGKIDQILSSNADDRRGVLEEAAGIVKYKTRREEAQRKLARTQENLTRVEDILYEISNQIGPLKLESEKAKKFLGFNEKLKFYELNKFVENYNRFSEKIERDRGQVELLKEEIARQKKSLAHNEQRRDELKVDIVHIDEQIEAYNVKNHEIEYAIKTLYGDIEINNEKINQANRTNNELRDDIQNQYDEIDNKSADIEGLKGQLVAMENDRAVLLSREDEYSKELEDIEEMLIHYRVEVSHHRQNFDSIRERLSKDRENIAHVEAKISGFDARLSQLVEALSDKKKRLEQLKADRLEHNSHIDELKKKLSSLNAEKHRAGGELEGLRKKVGYLDEKIVELSKLLDNKKVKYTLLDDMDKNYDGYYRSVKAILTGINRGAFKDVNVCGVIAELMDVPKGLERAMEVALGSSMQFIVTNTEEDAKVMIEYLKKYNYGRATFLPLTSIKGRGLSKREQQALNMDGCVGIASQLIDYDEKYSDIFKYLLGRILIVKTMDEAIDIARYFSYRFKIVTLDGDVINAGGSMTGGSSSNRGTNLLSRRREVEDLALEIKKLESKLVKLREEQAKLNDKLVVNTGKVNDIESQITKSNMEVAVYIEKAQSLDNNIEALDLELTDNNKEKSDIEKRRRELAIQHTSLLEGLDILKGRIGEADKQMEGWELEEQNLLKEKEEVNRKLTDVKVKLASIHQDMISKRENKEFLLKQIDRHRESIYSKEKRIENNKALVFELEEKNSADRVEIEGLKGDIESVKANLEKFLEQKTQLEGNMEELYVDYKRLEEEISTLVEKRHDLDIRISRTEVEMDNIQDNMWDDYNISYNGALEYYDETLSHRHIENQIKDLKGKIQSLGEVNVNAIEQYKKLAERHNFLNGQKKDLELAMCDLQKVIEDITTTMERQFAKELKIINIYFNEVFSQLFGGGTARLILGEGDSVLECDIEIEAQPPGKRLQNISLLSGGEKALTAISLLFAILRRKPCPFCVLDEIDAALDEGNLNNFCNFINEFTDNTQFVIITHRKPTMEVSDVLYGITMEEKGVSRIVSVRFEDMAS